MGKVGRITCSGPSRLALVCALACFLLLAPVTWADSWSLSLSGGKAPGEDQDNSLVALDYEFARKPRSLRTSLSLGVSYAYMRNNANVGAGAAHVLSLYPQLTLHPQRAALRNTWFFVRALGPSYLSDNQFGHLRQSNHVTFLAQVGIGYRMPLDGDNALLWQVSWRHYSNANLFSDNDGIDFPVTLSIGLDF